MQFSLCLFLVCCETINELLALFLSFIIPKIMHFCLYFIFELIFSLHYGSDIYISIVAGIYLESITEFIVDARAIETRGEGKVKATILTPGGMTCLNI